MRILVLGGSGNFGARIVRALRGDPAIELIAAGRRPVAIEGAADVPFLTLDTDASQFAARLRAAAPGLVIHCVGPFQGQDYRVAHAALAAGAHYLDLADGREFVAGFRAGVGDAALAARRVAISGASTLPALSSAVIEALRGEATRLETIATVIAPGQRAPRGAATLAAVFSYLGRPYPVWRAGAWQRDWGWMNLCNVRLDFGRRLGASCDVPDLALFPEAYAVASDVIFHAALEFRAQHFFLWLLAALRRAGLPLPVSAWAARLNRLAGIFDVLGGEYGGMSVAVTLGEGTTRTRRIWQLTAPAVDGPQIPCMAAILLARRFAHGEVFEPGAHPCMGFLSLAEFAPEFGRWNIRQRIEERAA